MSHLLATAALVLEAGGDEDQAIAGLLHDTLEAGKSRDDELAELFWKSSGEDRDRLL